MAKAPIAVPPALLAPDRHPVVDRARAALAKKFRPTRHESIDEGVIICWYLVSLERAGEADELARTFASLVTYDPRRSVWTSACDARCLSARIARKARKKQQAAALVAPILENPAFAEMSKRDFVRWVAGAANDLAEARAEKSATWARVGAIAAVTRACYFRETAGHGFYYDSWVDTASLDEIVDGAIAVLRDRLGYAA